MSNGLRFVSAWPYQYTSGTSAFALSDTGAVVAAVPSGFAGDAVGMGPSTGATDTAPGAAQPPYTISPVTQPQTRDATHLARVDIHEERRPALARPRGVVGEQLAQRRLSCVLGAEHEHARRVRARACSRTPTRVGSG